MKFSVFTASTPEWRPADTARILAEQGWDGIEWRVTNQIESAIPGFWEGNLSTWSLDEIEASVPEIARITGAAGLEFSGIGGYAKCFDHDSVERMLATTAALGARQVRVTMPVLGTGNYRDLFHGAREDLEWIAVRAEHHGVKALVELHHRTITSSASAALRLVDGLDPERVGVIHDIGNTVIEGHEDYTAAFQMLGEYLAHIHVKNVGWAPTGQTDRHGAAVWTEDWAPLAAGQADIAAYFEALAQIGYDGWVTVEDFSTEIPLEQRTRENLDYLRSVYRDVYSLV